MGYWPDAAVETLTRMWREGSSGTEIANALGNAYSRSAVMGKVSRVSGLKGGPHPRPQSAPGPRRGLEQPSLAETTPSPPAGFQRSPLAMIQAALYADPSGCKWPIGDPKKPDYRCCGELRADKNYCARHKALALGKPKPVINISRQYRYGVTKR